MLDLNTDQENLVAQWVKGSGLSVQQLWSLLWWGWIPGLCPWQTQPKEKEKENPVGTHDSLSDVLITVHKWIWWLVGIGIRHLNWGIPEILVMLRLSLGEYPPSVWRSADCGHGRQESINVGLIEHELHAAVPGVQPEVPGSLHLNIFKQKVMY